MVKSCNFTKKSFSRGVLCTPLALAPPLLLGRRVLLALTYTTLAPSH
jgi:hypothetical protein